MMSTPSFDQQEPARLPLLDAFVEERTPSGYRLDVAAALLVQHQLPTIVPMTETLISLGIDPEHLHWIDIPYTADEAVERRLAGLGVPVENFKGGPGADADLLTRRGIRKVMANGASRAYAETTSFVNVAEARPKLTIEPPLIGDKVVQALMANLSTQDPEVADGPTLILGYGAIGRAVARALAGSGAGTSRHTIDVYDPDRSATSEAQRDGFDTWDRTCVPPVQYRLVIGCSGTTSFGVGDRRSLADGAVLVSASSGAAELSRERFIELADTHTQDDIWVHDRETLSDRDIHSTIRIHLVDRSVSFLNGGFPINFDGRTDGDPPDRIQLTRTLMVAGAVQAVEADGPGIRPLDDGTCDWLEQRFAALLGDDVPKQELPSASSHTS